MKKSMIAIAMGAATLASIPALAPTAVAQTRAEQRRWDDAQRRFDTERSLYENERRRFEDARARGSYRGGPSNYSSSVDSDRYRTDYDASRYYRDDPRYTERRLGDQDEVYRGSDGRYYCKRNDGTTGLIVGGATGALLGNVIDGGRNRAGGTLIGGALGALLGRSVERNQQEVRCR